MCSNSNSKALHYFLAVVLCEVAKLAASLILVFCEENMNILQFGRTLQKTIVNKIDMLKICVPSLVFVGQNNFLYVAAANLDAVTYVVSFIFNLLIIFYSFFKCCELFLFDSG